MVNDKIAAVGKDLTVVLPELETVEASGKILTPGFIDQHIHVTGGGGKAVRAAVRLKSFSVN